MSNENETANENATIDRAIETNQSLVRKFDGVALAHENAATQALIAKETATIQARWIMAMRSPRSMAQVRTTILKEMERPGFPEVAIYRVPRAGNTIKGLSIRTAEVMMRCMGNMACDAQTLFDSPSERVIRVTAVDYETNATWSRDITVKKTVERKRLGQGQRAISTRANSFGDQIFIVEASDDDFRTKEAAEISKASRTAILRLIPGHIQDEAFDKCENLFEQKIATNPDEFKNKICDAFARLGVMPAELERVLGHSLDTVSAAELQQLRAIGEAIKSGDGVWAEMADAAIAEREARKASGVKPAAKTDAKGPANGERAKSETKSGPPPAAQQPAPAGKGTQAVKDKINKAAPPKQEPKPETAKAEPSPAAEAKTVAEPAPDIKPAPAPAHAAPEPEPVKEGYEERQCADCGCTIEVPKTDPSGSVCYACANA